MNKHVHKRIAQIIPADGWLVVYAGDTDEDPISAGPLCAWGLVIMDCWEPGCKKPVGEMRGLVASGDGMIDVCGDEVNFLGYVPPGQDPMSLFKDASRLYRERMGKAIA